MTPERTANARLVTGFLVAVVVGFAGCVVDAFAAFCLTSTCQTSGAAPSLLAVALLVAVTAYAVPALVVGWQRSTPAVVAGVLGAIAPSTVLVWFVATPQSGFCF